MIVASVAGWPLWLIGIAVGIVFYVALAYLVVRGVGMLRQGVRRGASYQRGLREGADVFHGRQRPTLLEVAQERSAEPSSRSRARPRSDRSQDRRAA